MHSQFFDEFSCGTFSFFCLNSPNLVFFTISYHAGEDIPKAYIYRQRG
jgi:hypothetical protein